MKMKTLVLGLVFLASSLVAVISWAGPDCTKEPKDKWKDQELFKKSLVDQGYKIKVFKVTSGNCYEIYGWNKAGAKVEIYFNPITGDTVKEKIN